MPKVKINNTELEYLERGTGEPVILIHGSLGDFRSWDLQLDSFSKEFHVITYSRRFHYPNDCKGDEAFYSAALHADDLADLIEALNLGSAHVVGNSYGAYTALVLARRHPERVRSMVLGEPPVMPLLENHKEGKPLWDTFLREVWEPVGQLMRQGKAEEGITLFVNSIVEEGVLDNFPPEVKELIMDNACEFTLETTSPDYWTPFRCEDARQIETRTLLLSGQESLDMFIMVVDVLEDCLPNNRRVRIPESTHEMSADNPEAYNALIVDFLSRNTL